MRTRLLISALVLPFFVWMLLAASPIPFIAFATLVAGLGMLEYGGILKQRGLKPAPLLGLLFVLAWMAARYPSAWLPGPLAALSGLPSGMLMGAAFLALAWFHVLRGDAQGGMASLWADLFGVLWLGWLGSFFVRLHLLPFGGYWSFSLFFMVWVYDAGAYFIGRSLGRTPLSPLSPKKTVEGLLGGLAITVALSVLLLPMILPAGFPLSRRQLALLGVLAGLFAQAGDLLESMLKRHVGVKDSGRLLLKLGGFLDKLDSPLFTAPLFWWVATHLN
jgi:phosphatidate cytidylyltransferase